MLKGAGEERHGGDRVGGGEKDDSDGDGAKMCASLEKKKKIKGDVSGNYISKFTQHSTDSHRCSPSPLTPPNTHTHSHTQYHEERSKERRKEYRQAVRQEERQEGAV